MAYEIWTAIHDQFHDNELYRAVYLEAEFQSLVQGDMDVTAYTGRLKQLADALRDVGQPMYETSQVLNMLRGLSPKYRHAVPAITAKQSPHTFLSARSYLLLEEHYGREQAKTAQHQALLTTGGSRIQPGGDGGSSSPAPRTPAGHDILSRPDSNRSSSEKKGG